MLQDLLYEAEPRMSLIGGVYRGPGPPTPRQQGGLTLRNRMGGREGFPENTQLLSAGAPVPHAVGTVLGIPAGHCLRMHMLANARL